MKNADMPAAPLVNENGAPHFIGDLATTKENCTGLTKREMFTMHALSSVLDMYNPYEQGNFDSSDYEQTAVRAVGLADALLKELEK